jgi:hypothetical protein
VTVPAADPAGAEIVPLPRRVGLLRLAIAAFAAWVLALGALALLTANPVAISREQLEQADAVVLARMVEGQPRIRVERVLGGNLAPEDVVTVLNLDDVPGISPAKSYVIPLTRFRQDYAITMLRAQRPPPLIYPAGPETIGRARDILREAGK